MTLGKTSHPLFTATVLEKLAIVYLRQSTPDQKEHNWGSAEVQRQQADLAHAYGFPRDRIVVIDEDLGKSGKTTSMGPIPTGIRASSRPVRVTQPLATRSPTRSVAVARME